MIQNVKPFAEIKGTVAENNIQKTYVGNNKQADGTGLLGGWQSPMFSGQQEIKG